MTAEFSFKLLIMGDSIALGATEVFGTQIDGYATPGFVERLRWRRGTWTIQTDASVHRTTVQAIERLPGLLRDFRPDVVFFVIGGSDADIEWKRFIVSRGERLQNNTPINLFKDNLHRLIACTQAYGARPILSDLPSQDVVQRGIWMSKRVGLDLLPWIEARGGQVESDRQLATYSSALDTVSCETNTEVVRWARAVNRLPLVERFGPDATHPGTQAHGVITDVVEEALARVAVRPRPLDQRKSAHP
ncbi:MAG: family lipolytic protein [Phycisphaerales bacterium]|nr:family lipolytic protein [Phycisphaerales bacterium]